MKEKAFDCVRMKSEIQQRILEEIAGLSPEEQREKAVQAIESDPILRRFLHGKQRAESERPAHRNT